MIQERRSDDDEAAPIGESLEIEWRNELGWPAQISAVLLRRGPRSVVVTAADAPPVDSLVSVRDGQAFYRATVHGCRVVDERMHFELRYTDDGRRRRERLAAGGEAKISWDSGGRLRTHFIADVLNVSEGGLQLLSKDSVPVGAYVQVAGETTDCVGRVRYCRETPHGHLIGVEFVRSVRSKETDALSRR